MRVSVSPSTSTTSTGTTSPSTAWQIAPRPADSPPGVRVSVIDPRIHHRPRLKTSATVFCPTSNLTNSGMSETLSRTPHGTFTPSVSRPAAWMVIVKEQPAQSDHQVSCLFSFIGCDMIRHFTGYWIFMNIILYPSHHLSLLRSSLFPGTQCLYWLSFDELTTGNWIELYNFKYLHQVQIV